MGWFDSLFGSKQTNETQQSGTSTTTNNANLDPRFQNFWNQYANVFSGASGANTPINPWQTGAADQLAGAGQYVFPAYGAANDVAQNGITTGSISKYLSPYTQNVVDATQAQFNTNNAKTLAGQQASMAKAGALTGTQRQVGRGFAEGQLQAQQAPVIAGLYNQGYQNAVDTAVKDAQTRTGAAGTMGNLVNAYTGTGSAAYNAGQGIWGSQYQNTMTPFQLMGQGAAGWSPFLSAAGSSTNSTGTTNSTGYKTDSPFDIGMDLFGGAKALGFFADGGAVSFPKKPKEFHEKVMDAFQAVTHMRKAAGGGVVPHYDAGGFVDPMDNDPAVPGGPSDPNWTPVVERAPEQSGFSKWLSDRNAARAQSRGANSGDYGIGATERSMLQFMAGLQPRADGGDVRLGHRDGNAVWDAEGGLTFNPSDDLIPSYGGFKGLSPESPVGRPYVAPTEERAPESNGFFSGLTSYLPSVKREGVITGDKITPDQSIGAILSGMGRGRARDSILALSNNRFKELEAEREAGRLLGMYQGKPTMDAQRLALDKSSRLGVIDGYDTLEGRRQAEAERIARLPEYKENTGNYDPFGRPVPGWINRNNAPVEAQTPQAPYRTLPTSGNPRGIQPQPMPAEQPITPAALPKGPGPATGTPGSTADNPVLVQNRAAEAELVRTAPGTHYIRQWDPTRVQRTPDNPAAPEMSTSPVPPSNPQGFVDEADNDPGAPRNATAPQRPVEAPRPAPTIGTPPPTPGVVPIGTSTSNMDTSLTGSDALNQAPPILRTKVLQALDGRIAPPTGMGLRDQMQQQILSMAQMVDPSFDMSKWAVRHKMQMDYSPGGKIGNNLASASMSVNHLYDLMEATKKLNNYNLPGSNLLREYGSNWVAKNFDWESKGADGKTVPKYADRLADFELKRKLAMEELGKFLRGSGAGNLTQHQELMETMNAAKSEGELLTAVKGAIQLLGGKMEPYAAAYNQTFNTNRPVADFLSPEAKKHLDLIQGNGNVPTRALELNRPIEQMSIEDLKGLPREKMSPDQLRAASQRLQDLSKGPRP